MKVRYIQIENRMGINLTTRLSLSHLAHLWSVVAFIHYGGTPTNQLSAMLASLQINTTMTLKQVQRCVGGYTS